MAGKKIICYVCGKEIQKKKVIEVDVYKTPYSRKPKRIYLCSDKCRFKLTDTYQRCNECGRYIENPDGERKRNFEIIRGDYLVCWRCYEKMDIDEY